MAPEVITGETSQSCNSDMFSAGGVLHNLLDFGFLPTECVTHIRNLAEQCRSIHHRKRPSSFNSPKDGQIVKTVIIIHLLTQLIVIVIP